MSEGSHASFGDPVKDLMIKNEQRKKMEEINARS
jgi:hypothetical protein